jgi:hypothetical protein
MLAFLHTAPWWMTLLLLPLVIVSAMVGVVLKALGVVAAMAAGVLVAAWGGLRLIGRRRPPVEIE